jgi:hypothetical protein
MEQRAEPVSQATRSQWQRRAAGLLLHLVDQNQRLPAITGTISPDGHLSGRPGHAIRPQDGQFAFTTWQETLQLSRQWELPGRDGRPGSTHATGTWGAVTVSLAARVLPRDPAGTRPGDGRAAVSGHPLTRRLWLPAWVLPDLLEQHAAVPAITWQVSLPGELTGHISAAASARGGRDIFAAWRQALGLESPVRTPARLIASAEFSSQPVTVTVGMTARRPDPPPARVITARRPIVHWMIPPGRHCAQAPARPGRQG